jgi:hypothetical protein
MAAFYCVAPYMATGAPPFTALLPWIEFVTEATTGPYLRASRN